MPRQTRTFFPIGSFAHRGEHCRVRFLAVLGVFLLCGADVLARIGIVRTTDGRTLQGHVRFTPERVVIANAEAGSVWSVAVTNLSLISFPTNSYSRASEEPVDQKLPGPWREVDIGHARLPGSTRYESGIFTVRGSGLNIDGEADSFHYVYKLVRGDSEIVAEVVSIQYTHPFAKAGLMMRESLNEYSKNVMFALTAERGGALQSRTRERAYTDVTTPRALFAPMWMKLRRRGDEFTTYVSQNGRLWSLLDRVTVPMTESIFVGLAVAGAQDGVLNWTTFSKVREAAKLVNESYVPEVELVSGSIVTGRPLRADENEIVFEGAPKIVRTPIPRVARIAFHPLSGDMAWRMRISRPGVWVSNGDFFDGDFRGIENRKITISSVLYGLRTFDLDEEVLAVVLQPRRLRRAPFEVETADGATVLASELAVGDGELRLSEPALGELRIPAFEILEVRRR